MAAYIQTADANTVQLVRDYFHNRTLEIIHGDVWNESTSQKLGFILEGEDAVIEHLRLLCEDRGEEWNGVDTADLYNDPGSVGDGLKLIDADAEIWLVMF